MYLSIIKHIVPLSFIILTIAVLLLFLYIRKGLITTNKIIKREIKGIKEQFERDINDNQGYLKRELSRINKDNSNKSNKGSETSVGNLAELKGLKQEIAILNQEIAGLKEKNKKQYDEPKSMIIKPMQEEQKSNTKPDDDKQNQSKSTEQINNNSRPDQSTQVDSKKEDKIWVQKTMEGLKKLEISDTKKDMYLLKSGNDFLLNLVDLSPTSYTDIMSLYDSIIIFPAGFKAINEVIMLKNPKYSKHGDFFQFEDQGEITVN